MGNYYGITSQFNFLRKRACQSPPSAPSLGIVFIDPTGISKITFDTIRTLTSERKMDLIINFPEGMGIRMNLHQYTESEESALDVFMGSSNWKQQFHQIPTSFPQACRQIANEYLENLRSLGYQVLDDNQIPVRTTGNSLLYYLIFARSCCTTQFSPNGINDLAGLCNRL